MAVQIMPPKKEAQLSMARRRALQRQARMQARNPEPTLVPFDDDELDDGDRRPAEDPLQVKGQKFVSFSFMVDKEAFEKNGGLVDPYKDIAIKFSGAFKTYAQCVEHNRRLARAYNDRDECKLYHQLFNVGMYKWSLLPNIDVVVEDEDNPEKVRTLVPLLYEQERIAEFMASMKNQQEEDKAENKRRIEETQLLAKKGKTTLAELKASEAADTSAIEHSNVMDLLKEMDES